VLNNLNFGFRKESIRISMENLVIVHVISLIDPFNLTWMLKQVYDYVEETTKRKYSTKVQTKPNHILIFPIQG
jgi:hypothetical protein